MDIKFSGQLFVAALVEQLHGLDACHKVSCQHWGGVGSVGLAHCFPC